MKIIVTNATPTQPTPKTVKELQFYIAGKLNALVCSSANFFSWNSDDLKSSDCANRTIHNRLIILLALFTDSRAGTYTKFYSPVCFSGYDTFEKLQSLKDFVDSIPPLQDIKIELA